MFSKSGKTSNAKSTNKSGPKSAPPASYDWTAFLNQSLKSSDGQVSDFAPVSSFKYAPLCDLWDDWVTPGLKVEVRNPDCSPALCREGYWIANVIRSAGYFVLLRYEGFGSDSSADFWLNVFTSQIHPVGWCASQGKVLVPPAQIENKLPDFKSFLIKRLTGSRTLPENFLESLKDSIRSRFVPGMRLEVVDKNCISSVRVGIVKQVVGGRLHIVYEDEEEDGNGFWCHQFSPLLHPVGWAQLIGHKLTSSPEYRIYSLNKAVNNTFDVNDADWTLFPPVRVPPLLSSSASNIHNNSLIGQHNLMQRVVFEEGMKLEAIDPLKLSNISVATVMKVLRSNYLMIGIDGWGSKDWFCYHSGSSCIFPVGFCKRNNIELTPPKGYDKNTFDWQTYLKEQDAVAAPAQLFRRESPRHSFKAGQMLEAVDLMEPRLVCVATITRVVERLLRIHFNGWDESYDQWCDCEAPELFPIGWCQLVGYPLQPPGDPSTSTTESVSRRKKKVFTGKSRKRKFKMGAAGGKDTKEPTGSTSNQDAGACDSGGAEDDEDCHNDDTDSEISSIQTPRPEVRQERKVQPELSSPRQVSDLSNSSVVVRPSPPEPVTKSKDRGDCSLRDDPRSWSVADVCSFLSKNFPGSYAAACRQRQIDGEKLLSLSEKEIMQLTEVNGMAKVGPALKLQALINSLKSKKM